MYDFDKQQIIEPKRQFTGVWLPRELLLDDKLQATDKILYAEIASFGDKGCWKRAEELRLMCGIGRDGFRAACARLRDGGYIVECRSFGRIIRYLSIYATDEKQQRTENPAVQRTENPAVHIDNTIDNTIDNINSEVSKKLLDLLNEKTKRNFRILPRGYKETLKKFSLEEIGKALDVLVEDDWHSKKINELKSDYLLRASTIDNMLSKRKKQHEGMADLDELMGDGSWMA